MIQSLVVTVEQAKSGDKDAFSLLYSYYYKEMYKYALYMLRNADDVEDVIADTIVDAYKSIISVRKNESFKYWLFSILLAKIRKKLKAYATQANATVSEHSLISDDSAYAVNTDLKAALDTLDPEKKSIVTLSILGGYTSKEIAQILGKNPSTVRSDLARTLKKLQMILS